MIERTSSNQGPSTTAEPARPLGAPAPPMSPAQWLVVGVMLSGLCLIVWALKRQAAIMKSGAASTSRGSGTDHKAHGEMQDLTRELIAELDRKSASLETQLREADAKIKALKTASQAAPAQDPVKARVYQLADQGASALDIAKATGLPTGQVELMLGLRRIGG
ncbi:MAG: hypothetical protein ACK54H_05075 [Phycisphaerales bacterium]